MAEGNKRCVVCGGLLKVFSGLTINGDTYHAFCWDTRDKPVPKARAATGPDQASPSGGGRSDQPYARPMVMPVVEQLQLGNTRAVMPMVEQLQLGRTRF